MFRKTLAVAIASATVSVILATGIPTAFAAAPGSAPKPSIEAPSIEAPSVKAPAATDMSVARAVGQRN